MKTIFSFIIGLSFFSILNAQNAQIQVPTIVKGERTAYEHRTNSALKINNTNYNYDVKYYRLKVSVNPTQQFVTGEVTFYFVPTAAVFQEMIVDCHANLSITNATYHGNNLSTSILGNDQSKLSFSSPLVQGTIDSVTIQYNGAPPSTGFGSFNLDTHGSAATPVLWTLSEPFGAKDWWVCKNTTDDKADSLDVYITAPSQYRAASNGLLVSEITDAIAGKKTAHWKHRYPITTYLVAIAVTNYSVYSDYLITNGGQDSLEILNYVYPEDLGSAQPATAEVGEIISFFESKFGDYPFRNEKYGHAQFGWGGGEEHQTMSFVTNYDYDLLAHELAHQWFGDKITCGSFQDIFLNEGFATYCAAISDEFLHTPNAWDTWKIQTINYITQVNDGSVFCTDTTDINRIFNWRWTYQKGAMILHMLRWKMGDAAFFQGVHDYMQDANLSYNYSKITDLQQHLETASGLTLNEYFDDWYYGEGFPVYQILWNDGGFGTTYIKINQTQSHPSVAFFEMPLPIQFKDATGNDTTVIVDPTASGQMFSVHLNFVPTIAVFDPQHWILCKSSTLKTNTIDISLAENHFAEIYPNPTKDNLHISSDKSQFIARIFDLQGKELFTQEMNSKESNLPINFLAPGIYMLNLENGNMVDRKRFVKE